jgi:hypothetical protein
VAAAFKRARAWLGVSGVGLSFLAFDIGGDASVDRGATSAGAI